MKLLKEGRPTSICSMGWIYQLDEVTQGRPICSMGWQNFLSALQTDY
jgi:hypothetical protein